MKKNKSNFIFFLSCRKQPRYDDLLALRGTNDVSTRNSVGRVFFITKHFSFFFLIGRIALTTWSH